MMGLTSTPASLRSDPGSIDSWVSLNRNSVVNGGTGAGGGGDLEAQMKEATDKEVEVRRQLAAHGQMPSSSTSGRAAINRNALAKKKAAIDAALKRRQKGIDVAVMLDCTGSMAPHIHAAQQKIKEIYSTVKVVHPEADARVAFVGYRDNGTQLQHGHHPQFQVKDFVPYDRAQELVSYLEGVRAGGGFGGCADVAGALQEAVELSWEADTRLVVHFADIAAHGSRYNDRGFNSYTGVAGCCTRWPDGGHPSGDAAFNLAALMSKRVNYYFGEICPLETKKMTDAFQEASYNMPKVFQVLSANASASDFVTVLESSLRSAMSGITFGSAGGSRSSGAIKAGAAAQRPLDPSIDDYLEY